MHLMSHVKVRSSTTYYKDLTLGTNQQPRGRHCWVYLTWKLMTTQSHQKITYDDIEQVFLAKKVEHIPSLREETTLTKIFSVTNSTCLAQY